jgi:hypothetical protein
MELREKIEAIIKSKGISQRKFAESIGVNHISFNRNMNNNNITGEMVKAFIMHLQDVDLNWLFKSGVDVPLEVNEPNEVYGNISEKKLTKAIKLLEELKKDLTRE